MSHVTTETSANAPTTPLTVRKTLEVRAPLAVAFRVFAEDMTSWWDLESHHVGKAKAVAAVVEPFAGGRWFERGDDGSECDWGKVLAWEPPGRLLLQWQLDADFEYDARLHTEVEVRFTAIDGGRTRVELEHRLLEAYGGKAARMQSILGSEGGWTVLVAAYGRAADAIRTSR